jgi:hypothetical protein
MRVRLRAEEGGFAKEREDGKYVLAALQLDGLA